MLLFLPALLALQILLCGFDSGLRLLPNNVKHTIFEGLLVLIQKVLLPVVLASVWLEVVSP